MPLFVKHIALALVLCALSNPVFAQDKEGVTFELKLSKERLGVNERLRADFEMNRDGDNFVPPDFEGFRILMGPSQAISSSWINGVRSYSKTYSYTLAPLAKGEYTIGQASIVIGGNTYKTIPKKVTACRLKKPNWHSPVTATFLSCEAQSKV